MTMKTDPYRSHSVAAALAATVVTTVLLATLVESFEPAKRRPAATGRAPILQGEPGIPMSLNRFESCLAVLAPVRPGEGRCVAVVWLQAFALMAAYYLIRPVREALILAEGGAEGAMPSPSRRRS
jgi:hypothetical protein